MTKPKGTHATRRPWTEVELTLLRANYSDTITHDLATALGRPVQQVYAAARRLGLAKSEAFQASDLSGRMLKGGRLSVATQFKPGQVSWNKGLKGVVGVQEGCRATQFRPGNKPATWVPIGSFRICDGVLQQKLNDVPGPNHLRWFPVHRLVWEAAHGTVPAGHLVRFVEGLQTTVLEQITLDRLECVSRAENMRRNSFHRYGEEVARVVQLRGALTRQINKQTKEST